MEYTPLRKPQPPTEPSRRQREAMEQARQKRKCPPGFRWDSKNKRCVQAGVGPGFRP